MSDLKHKQENDRKHVVRMETFGRHWMGDSAHKRNELAKKYPEAKIHQSRARHYRFDKHGGTLKNWTPNSRENAIKNSKM